MKVKAYLKIGKTEDRSFQFGITKRKSETALSVGDSYCQTYIPTIIVPLEIELDDDVFVTETKHIKVVPQFVTRIEPVEEPGER